MARIVNCPCGHTLTGKDDEELFSLAKQHVEEHHRTLPAAKIRSAKS